MLSAPIAALAYRLISRNQFDSFESAAPWRGSLGNWSCSLVDSRLEAAPNVKHESLQAAQADLEPKLRDWQTFALLDDLHDIVFVYEMSLLTDGSAVLADEDRGPDEYLDRTAIYRRENEAYPAPDASFSGSPVVDELVEQIQAFLRGDVSLPSAAARVMSGLESIHAATEQTDGLARALNIEPSVLNKFAELAQRTGEDHRDERARYRGPEWQWFQEALRRLAIQAGRSDGAPTRAPLSMADFRARL